MSSSSSSSSPFFLSFFAHQLADAQTILPAYCTDGTAYADYFQCNYSNSETCGNCVDVDYILSNTLFTFCANLAKDVCPYFHCCSACKTMILHYYECFIFPVYITPLPQLQSCGLDCSAFPYGSNQIDRTEPCSAEFEDWAVCTSKDYVPCLDCFIESNLTLPSDSSICAENQQDYCFEFDCCLSCRSELSSYYKCDSNISTTNNDCQVICNGVDISNYSGKGINSGIKIKCGAEKYVTVLLYLLLMMLL